MDYEIKDFIGVFDGVFGHKLCDRYIEHYKDLEENDLVWTRADAKLQKTVAGEGYHVWHAENTDLMTRNRLLVFMLYLNDDFEGGETEFL